LLWQKKLRRSPRRSSNSCIAHHLLVDRVDLLLQRLVSEEGGADVFGFLAEPGLGGALSEGMILRFRDPDDEHLRFDHALSIVVMLEEVLGYPHVGLIGTVFGYI